MASRVVCISRARGALGEQVGREVAQRLGSRYVDEEIVASAAQKEDVDPEIVADAERRKGLLERILSGLAVSGADLYVAPVPPEVVMSERYRELIRDAIEQTAAQGDVVIVAHAASHVLAGRTEALRVWVTGSPDACAERLVATAGVDAKRAGELVEGGRKARADYLRRFHDVKQELPSQYDVVLSTDALSVDDAAAAVVMLAGRP